MDHASAPTGSWRPSVGREGREDVSVEDVDARSESAGAESRGGGVGMASDGVEGVGGKASVTGSGVVDVDATREAASEIVEVDEVVAIGSGAGGAVLLPPPNGHNDNWRVPYPVLVATNQSPSPIL